MSGAVPEEVRALSGREVLDRLLGLEDPGGAVKDLAPEDFFWIMKKVGEDDALPLLQLASLEQWQFVVDLAIWKKDRIGLREISAWLLRLLKADPGRLAGWLLGEGVALGYFYLQQAIRVEVKSEEDQAYEPPPDAFSLDDIFHIRVLDPDQRDLIEELLRWIAKMDYQGYQALLLELQGVVPSELEEALYRMRNVRMAEHGFLPFDEALAVYAPLSPKLLVTDGGLSPELVIPDEAVRAMIPTLPFALVQGGTLLRGVASRMTEPVLMDKMRLEFAGLCNQILSAEAHAVYDLDLLVRTCRRAAAHLNLALEKCFGVELSKAKRCLSTHPLVSVFRVGYGLALQVRWEAERWAAESWFRRRGLPDAFWGAVWGPTLAGILEKHPRFYMGPGGEEEWRDFQHLSDLEVCREILGRLRLLDNLLSRLEEASETRTMAGETSFHVPLFTFWARKRLGSPLSFSGIPAESARRFIAQLREGEKGPSYRMAAYQEGFKEDLLAFLPGISLESHALFMDTLGRIWQEFQEEYEDVPPENLEARYSRFIRVT